MARARGPVTPPLEPSTVGAVRDAEIRAALDGMLTKRHGDNADTLIRHELGVCQGQRRVDVAVINGHLDGWEIKSDEDSLRRLEGQAEIYSKVLDRAWLVATDRHVERAAQLLPGWWGVLLAHESERGVQFKQVRRPRMSPAIDPMSVAQLMWREEVMAVLKERGLAYGLSGRARWYLWERLAQSLPLTDLRRVARDTLRARQEWSGGQRRP